MDSLGYGIHFSGTSTIPQQVRRNHLNTLTNGIWLSNGAIIGQQGNTATSQDNEFVTPVWMNRLYTSGANPVTAGNFSPFYYRPQLVGGLYNPNPTVTDNSSTPVTTFVTSTTPPLPQNCQIIPAALQPMDSLELQKQIAQSVIDMGNDDVLWIAKENLYRNMRADDSLYVNDSVLTHFKDSVDLEATGKLYDSWTDYNASKVSPQQQVDTAAQRAGAITVTNNGEQYMKTVVSIALNAESESRMFTPVEIAELQIIAVLCPYTDGDAVFFARTLLMLCDTAEYVTECELETQLHHFEQEVQNGSDAGAKTPVTVNPNPNNGQFVVSYQIADTDNAVLEVYTITGSLVRVVPLSNHDQSVVVDLNELEAGIYMYRFRQNGITRKMDKIVIIK